MAGMLRAFVALGVTAFAVALAGDAQAQAADQKRSLKAMEVFYKEPGMCDVEIQAMRTTLMITGTVPTEDHKKKADELGSKVRGVKDVRNRLNVREPEVAGGAVACDKIMERIDKKISEDEDLSQARRRMEITCEGTGDVKITGRVQDYTVARGLISDVRRIKGCNTIDFADLKY